MKSFRTVAASIAVCSLVTAACGGDDDAAEPDTSAVVDAPTTVPDTVGSNPCPIPAVDGPPATISTEIPEAFLPGIGPVAILGDSLPPLPQDPSEHDPATGMCAPILVGKNFDGEGVVVNASADGPTWLVFLAHWCPHCNDEIPVINELRDDGRLPDGLNVVGVSTAVAPDRPNWPPSEWLTDKDWTFEAIADGIEFEEQRFIAADAFGVSAFPFAVLINADGRVVDRWTGGNSADALASLLADGLAN